MPAVDFGDESRVEIAAPPEQVWAVISDVTRTPDWSPVCHRVEWIPPSTGVEVGARFQGHNKLRMFRWTRECVIDEVEAPRSFAFHTQVGGGEATKWRYTLAPAGEGHTLLTETYRAVAAPRWVWLLRKLGGAKQSDKDTRWNISTSLERIKQLAERGG
jgi:carbon monoxide dehydrogenase subunit G